MSYDQTNDDFLYIEDGYFTPDGYYVYTAIAQSQENLNSTLSAQCDVIRGADIVMTVAVTQDQNISRIRDVSAPLGTAFNSSMIIIATKNLGAVFTIDSTFTAQPERNRAVDVALSTIITQSLQSDRLRAFDSQITASATLASEAAVTKDIQAQLNSTFSQQTQTTNIIDSSATLSTTVSLTAQGQRVDRFIGMPTVYSGGDYAEISLSNTVSKFGGKSLRFHARTAAPNPTLIRFVNNQFVGVVSNVIYTSSDGITWTSVSNNLPSAIWAKLKYVNSTYIIGETNSTNFYTSSDLVTWTTRTCPTSVTFADITYSNSVWILASNTITGSSIRIHTSSDLTTWTQRYSIVGTYTVKSIETNGAGTTVAVGVKNVDAVSNAEDESTGFITYSTNATSWTTREVYSEFNGLGRGFNSIKFANNLWVAVGDSISTTFGGRIFTFTSPSGTLTTRTTGLAGISNAISNIEYANGVWLANNINNRFIRSTDAVTWTASELFRGIDANATYGSGRWISGNRYSTDAITWTLFDYNITPKPARIEYTANTDLINWKTIDFWIYSTDYSGTSTPIISMYDVDNITIATNWQVSRLSTASTNYLGLTLGLGGNLTQTTSELDPINEWHHVRIVLDGSNLSFFVDGVRKQTRTTTTFPSDTPYKLVFGGTSLRSSDVGTRSDFYIDEVLITDEILTPVSATTYTVPTQPWTNSAFTDALFHFDSNFDDDATALPRTVSAVIAIQSSAAASALGGAVSSAESNLSSQFTTSIAATKITDNNIAEDSAFTADFTGAALRESAAAFDSISTQLTAAAKVGNVLVSINSEFNQNITAAKITDSQINLNAEYAQSTAVNVTAEGQTSAAIESALSTSGDVLTGNIIAANTTFTQSVANSRLRDHALSISVTASQTTTAAVIRGIESSLVADAAQSVDYTRIRDFSTEFDSIATQITVSAKIGDQVVQINSVASVTAEAAVITDNAVSTTSTVSLVSVAAKTQQLESALSSQFAQTVSGEVFIIGAVSTSASTTLAATADVVRSTEVSLTAFAVELTVAEKTATADIPLTANTELTAQATVTRSTQAVLSSETQIASTAAVVTDNAVAANLTALLVTDGILGLIGEAQLTATAQLTADARKTTSNIIFEPVTVSQGCTAGVIRQSEAALTITATQNTLAERIRGFDLSITAFYSQLTVGSETSSGLITITVNTAMTVAGRLIIFDDVLTYKIPSEQRTRRILEERRTNNIVLEQRTYKIADS